MYVEGTCHALEEVYRESNLGKGVVGCNKVFWFCAKRLLAVKRRIRLLTINVEGANN